MKKCILLLFVLLIILFGFNSNSAYTANCAPGDLFNTNTGQPCSANINVECIIGDLFSSITGKPCTSWKDKPLVDISLNRELKVGSKGNDVRELQKLLKELGILLGKIDGSYGPITANAVKKYQQYNDINITGQVDSKTLEQIKTQPIPDECISTNEMNNNISTKYYCPPISTQPVSPNKETLPNSLKPITVLSPNGGEVWKVGSKQKLEWKWEKPPTKLLGKFFKDSAINFFHVIETPIDSSAGVFQFTVPDILNGNYFFELCDSYSSQGSFLCDQSDNVFTISGSSNTIVEPSVTLLFPKKEEKLIAGEKYKIVWEWTGKIKEVSLGLNETCPNGEWISCWKKNKPPGPESFFLTPYISNTGSFEWTIPKTIKDVPLNGYYQITVTSCYLSDYPKICVSDYNREPIMILPDANSPLPEYWFY